MGRGKKILTVYKVSLFWGENLILSVTASVFKSNIQKNSEISFSLTCVYKYLHTHACIYHFGCYQHSHLFVHYVAVPYSAVLVQFGEKFIWNFTYYGEIMLSKH